MTSANAIPNCSSTSKCPVPSAIGTIRKLACFRLLEGHDVKVFNNTVKGVGQLAARLSDVEAVVLIRERTRITRQLLEKLPKLRLISQTGRAADHVDVEACTDRGVAVLQGMGSPVAPAELTWALIMAAQRRIPQYVANLKQGAWQQSGLKTSALPPNFGLGQVLRGQSTSSHRAGQGRRESRDRSRIAVSGRRYHAR